MNAPLDIYSDVVRPAWIDENGHLNVGYYMVVFDFATDAFLNHIGFDRAFRESNSVSTFTVEAHATYEREVKEGDPLRFSTQLLAFDAKRIHYLHFMHHATEGYLAATNELLSLHMDMGSRRVAPMDEAILSRLERLKSAQAGLAPPPQVGRSIGLGAGRPQGAGRG